MCIYIHKPSFFSFFNGVKGRSLFNVFYPLKLFWDLTILVSVLVTLLNLFLLYFRGKRRNQDFLKISPITCLRYRTLWQRPETDAGSREFIVPVKQSRLNSPAGWFGDKLQECSMGIGLSEVLLPFYDQISKEISHQTLQFFFLFPIFKIFSHIS